MSAPDGVNFQVEVEPDLAAEGDRVLLRQVIVGLLDERLQAHARAGRRYASRSAGG